MSAPTLMVLLDALVEQIREHVRVADMTHEGAVQIIRTLHPPPPLPAVVHIGGPRTSTVLDPQWRGEYRTTARVQCIGWIRSEPGSRERVVQAITLASEVTEAIQAAWRMIGRQSIRSITWDWEQIDGDETGLAPQCAGFRGTITIAYGTTEGI